MKRKSILFLLLMVGICNALVAQSLTTKKEYYDWLGLHLQRKYTVLPDGTRHGKMYNYREDGTLESIYTYDHDHLEAYILYYQDGKTIDEKGNTPVDFDIYFYSDGRLGLPFSGLCVPKNLVQYDTRGKIHAQYTLKHTPGVTHTYYDVRMDYRLTSYSDPEWKYTLSSDGNRAEIKNLENGSHFTYDYKKEQLTIHSWEVGIEGKYDKWNNGNYYSSGKVGVLTIKGNTATYQFDVTADVESNGYCYRFNQGDKGTFQFNNTISMSIDEFCHHFFGECYKIRSIAIKDPSKKLVVRGSVELIPSNLITMSIMSDYLSKECVHLLSSIEVRYGGESCMLRLKDKNGSFENNDGNIQATIKNGKIESFRAPNFAPTKFEVVQNQEGLEIIMTEGRKDSNGSTLEGKFIEGELVEGRKRTYTSEGIEVEEGEFENEHLIQGLKRITKTSQRNDNRIKSETTYEGTFKFGFLINGTETYKEGEDYIVNTFKNETIVQREITRSSGSKVRMKGVIKEVPEEHKVWRNGYYYITKRENKLELMSGDLEIDLTGGEDLSIKRKRGSDIYLNAKTFKCSLPSNKICLVKKNGDRFEGVIPGELLNSLVWEYIQNYGSVQVIEGKYTTAQGNMLEGTFNKSDILYKGLDPRLHNSGSADFATEFGRYIGGYAACKAEGEGKIIIDDLGELTGTFAGDKISKDAVCTVDFKLPTGDTFKGQMLGGKAHGHCELRFANGDYYIGKFENGKFSGTGDVRYTHSKGVYEGKVKDFVCQYDTPQGKKALKKIKAPKMPKIALPSKVGKMM